MKKKKNNVNRKAELKAAFDSATSANEMLKTLRKMKDSSLFDENDLGLACWKSALKLAQVDQSQKILAGFDSKQRKVKRKAIQLFNSANSADEMLKAFRKMESHLNEKELGFYCWKLALKFYKQHQDPENILCYCKRALKFAIDHNNSTGCHLSSFMIVRILHAIGYACYKLSRYDESLIYLNWSERNLSKLVLDNSYPAELVFPCLDTTHFELAIVKTALGRGDEVVIHMKKILEIREKTGAKGSIDQAIEKVVDGLKGLGLSEQDKVDGAVRILKEMKESSGGGDSPENISKCGV